MPGRSRMELAEQAEKAFKTLGECAVTVHCITNYVTAIDVANMLLAAGAHPIMSDEPKETADIASASSALVLNIGTLSEDKLSAMINAGQAANRSGIPVVLDPVGAGASNFRKNAAELICQRVKISCIRANARELDVLGGFSLANGTGVDCDQESSVERVKRCAEKLGCVCAATGARDIISDGKRVITIDNGTTVLKRITGAGCMTSALAGAFSAAVGAFYGTAVAIAFMGICGELALEESGGTLGRFHTALFDKAGSMDKTIFCERLKAHEQS